MWIIVHCQFTLVNLYYQGCGWSRKECGIYASLEVGGSLFTPGKRKSSLDSEVGMSGRARING